MNSRTMLKTLIAGLLLVMAVVPLAAQNRRGGGDGRWSELWVVVKDIDSGEEIDTIEPSGRVQLPERAKVRLIMSAYVPGNDKAIYPETVYSEGERGRGGFRITKSSRENANVTLQLVDIKEAYGKRSERVNFQILDDRVPSNLQRGSFVIDVISDEESADEESNDDSGEEEADDSPAAMTRVLYRAILLREPDYPGAQGFTDRIAREGYQGVVKAAVAIADSNESRNGVYEKNANLRAERRLQILYKELLGLESDEASDSDSWEEDLRRVRDHRIASVVEEMVRSRAFRELHGW